MLTTASLHCSLRNKLKDESSAVKLHRTPDSVAHYAKHELKSMPENSILCKGLLQQLRSNQQLANA
jgi:hypothetical protein